MRRPINTHDATSCAMAYTSILGWALTRGHRYRPRSGCTCQGPAGIPCPTPGAHPLPSPPTATSPERLSTELETAPGAALIAPTVTFDAIVLPRQIGMAAMVSLDRYRPVPCLTTTEHATLLVLPSTARYAFDEGRHPAVELRGGASNWIALPPTHGVRWDTPPWDEQTFAPIPLLHGGELRPHLADVLRVARQARTA